MMRRTRSAIHNTHRLYAMSRLAIRSWFIFFLLLMHWQAPVCAEQV